MGGALPEAQRRAQDLRPRGVGPGAGAEADSGYHLFAGYARGIGRHGCRYGCVLCASQWESILGFSFFRSHTSGAWWSGLFSDAVSLS